MLCINQRLGREEISAERDDDCAVGFVMAALQQAQTPMALRFRDHAKVH